MTTTERIAIAVEECAGVCGCSADEFRGVTLRQAFQSAERSGATVFWGCWLDSELDSTI